MKIYLAGPEVFLPEAHRVFAQKLEVCRQYGVEGITPFDNELALSDFPPRVAAGMIFNQNLALLDAADAVLANITPFRGVHMDPGTAFELGYAFAKNKPVSAYTQDKRELMTRLEKGQLPIHHHPEKFQDQNINRSHGQPSQSPRFVDKAGYLIEDFGLTENLMIKCGLNAQGREIYGTTLPLNERFYSLEGFEDALKGLLKN